MKIHGASGYAWELSGCTEGQCNEILLFWSLFIWNFLTYSLEKFFLQFLWHYAKSECLLKWKLGLLGHAEIWCWPLHEQKHPGHFPYCRSEKVSRLLLSFVTMQGSIMQQNVANATKILQIRKDDHTPRHQTLLKIKMVRHQPIPSCEICKVNPVFISLVCNYCVQKNFESFSKVSKITWDL